MKNIDKNEQKIEKDDESIHYLDQLRLEELEEQGEYNYDFSFNKDYFRPKDLD